MAGNTSTKTAPVKDETPATEVKAKRKQLTPAERIAKIEADLAAAKEKAKERNAKQITKLQAERDALVNKRVDLDVKIDKLDKELADLGVTNEAPASDEGTSES